MSESVRRCWTLNCDRQTESWRVDVRLGAHSIGSSMKNGFKGTGFFPDAERYNFSNDKLIGVLSASGL